MKDAKERDKNAKRLDDNLAHRFPREPTGHARESKCTAKKRSVAAFVDAGYDRCAPDARPSARPMPDAYFTGEPRSAT
jgi:hypothetical protein